MGNVPVHPSKKTRSATSLSTQIDTVRYSSLCIGLVWPSEKMSTSLVHVTLRPKLTSISKLLLIVHWLKGSTRNTWRSFLVSSIPGPVTIKSEVG